MEQPTYDDVIKKTLTRIPQCPTRQDRDRLLKEIEHVLVDISVPAFEWTGKYGLLEEVRPAIAYRILSGLDYVELDDEEPSMTNPRIRKVNRKYRKEIRREYWNGYRTS